MAKKVVRYKRINGALVKQFEVPPLIGGLVDIASLPIVGTAGSAVIESGENANGRYIKWADGTMICWGNITFLFNSVDNYQEIRVVVPAEFSDVPAGFAYHRSMPGAPMQLVTWPSQKSYINMGFQAYLGKPNGTTKSNIYWFAIGKWK